MISSIENTGVNPFRENRCPFICCTNKHHEPIQSKKFKCGQGLRGHLITQSIMNEKKNLLDRNIVADFDDHMKLKHTLALVYFDLIFSANIKALFKSYHTGESTDKETRDKCIDYSLYFGPIEMNRIGIKKVSSK